MSDEPCYGLTHHVGDRLSQMVPIEKLREAAVRGSLLELGKLTECTFIKLVFILDVLMSKK